MPTGSTPIPPPGSVTATRSSIRSRRASSRWTSGLRIVAANRAAGTLLGRDPRTLVGRTVIEVFLDTQVEATALAGLGSGSATGEFGPAGADGPRLVVRARRAPSGSLWLVLEDVSELRRLQQIRTEFIDNLSHELRTPLTTVSLLAETLTREAEAAGDAVPPRMRDRIDKIEVETGHLVQMVNELLDLSRIESGGALGALEILDLGQIATDSTERLRLFADRQGVALRVDVGEPLPPVRGDAARLGQVIVNLLHNAVKFSPDGGDVVVAVRGSAGEVVVSIADHGVGHPGRCAAADLRALLQGRPGACQGRGRRHRARPRHRAPYRRAARRPDLGRVGRGHGQHVLVRAAERRRSKPDRGRVGEWPARHRSDWRTGAISGTRRRTRSRRSPRRSRTRAATGSSSMSALPPTGSRSINHDATLARLHGRPERVDELDAAELGTIGIPTLAEVLALAGSAPFLDVELKGDPGPAAIDVLVEGRGPALDRAVVSSFDAPALVRVARHWPDWPRWLNTHVLDASTVAEALALGCSGLCVDWRVLDGRSVDRATAAGLEVAAFTVRRRATFDRLARLGVVAVCVEAAALYG